MMKPTQAQIKHLTALKNGDSSVSIPTQTIRAMTLNGWIKKTRSTRNLFVLTDKGEEILEKFGGESE